MIPTIGRTVIVHGVPSNGSFDHPAVITRAWSSYDTKSGPVAVNLTVFVDNDAPRLMSSVMLYETADEARAACAGRLGAYAAHWPERV